MSAASVVDSCCSGDAAAAPMMPLEPRCLGNRGDLRMSTSEQKYYSTSYPTYRICLNQSNRIDPSKPFTPREYGRISIEYTHTLSSPPQSYVHVPVVHPAAADTRLGYACRHTDLFLSHPIACAPPFFLLCTGPCQSIHDSIPLNHTVNHRPFAQRSRSGGGSRPASASASLLVRSPAAAEQGISIINKLRCQVAKSSQPGTPVEAVLMVRSPSISLPQSTTSSPSEVRRSWSALASAIRSKWHVSGRTNRHRTSKGIEYFNVRPPPIRTLLLLQSTNCLAEV